ncbi:single-stranded DNA-binding protein [Thalassotalea sp. PLHSN55]|uniref:single-stranded DNA-binding protein n=1 Tax=Thalassotalea sp. PLHSN55 TaxID=3435888 RepID=UPI003F8539DB
MNNSFNSVDLCTVTLLGNLVAKPEIRYQANPVVAIAELTLATHSRWYDKSSQKFKEWTSFHTIKVIGDAVEQALIHADKGDVLLIQGYLLNSKKSDREIIHATFAQSYNKGYAQSLNQVQCCGRIVSAVKLVTTEKNIELAEFFIEINHQVYSPITQKLRSFLIKRPVHLWGKQASYIKNNAQENDSVVVDGKLNYLKDANKSQFIEAKQVDLLKK